MNHQDRNLTGVVVDSAQAVFQIPRRVFIDPDIMRLEREKIFDRCWLYMGHGSELKESGSFLRRQVAGRELIFSRDVDGELHVFYNHCPHRGGRICREKSGKSNFFHCFYHGWTFDTDGGLRKVPQEDLYTEDFRSRAQTSLLSVPRLEGYRDFWFISFDINAVPLADYLAGAKFYLDRIADQSAIGMEILPGAQEFSIRANWKLLHENGCDPFHVPTVHASWFAYTAESFEGAKQRKNDTGSAETQVMQRVDPTEIMKRRYAELVKSGQLNNYDLGNGHVAFSANAYQGRPFALWHPSWGADVKKEIDAAYAALVERLGQERADLLAHKNAHVLVFPNLAIVDNHGIMIRTYYPVTPDLMSVNSWTIAPKEEPLPLRRVRLYGYMEFLGPAGFGTPDDIEAIEQAQRGYRAAGDFEGWNDISAGMRPKDEMARAMHGDEGRMRVFWSKWDELINSEADSLEER